MDPFARIMVGWDGSHDSAHALQVAAELSEGLGAEVVVVAVLPVPDGETREDMEQETAGHRRQTTTAISSAVSGEAHIRVEFLEADRASEALADYAEGQGCGLLVLGRHGLDRAIHPRAGGVTERLVRHASCPVLVVSGRGDRHAGVPGG